MNIAVIPSWYPSKDNPHTGIFILEQATAIAAMRPDANVGILTWGSHRQTLLLDKNSLLNWPKKIFAGKRLKKHKTRHSSNCIEYFSPAFSWSRLFLAGNIKNIIKACEANLEMYRRDFGTPDIIHSHVAYPAGHIAMVLSEKLKIPYIITEHMSPFPFQSFRKKNGQLKSLIRDPYEKSQQNIAVSGSLASNMAAQGIPRVVMIPNLINEDFFVPVVEKEEREGYFNFAFIGRIDEQKGLRFLLEAFALLHRKHPGFRIIIAGTGPKLKEFKQLAADLNLNNMLEWPGLLTRQGVVETLGRSRAFVLPSMHENNPLVILEAHAMGKPVIATKCGGPEEIITPENGLLVEPGNAGQLASAMAQLIRTAHTYDSQAIRKSCLERYSKKVVTGKLVSLYREVISNYPYKPNTTVPHPQPPSSF